MGATFRQSMAWLHTWAGVTLGSLLFAIFWTGTLSVFDREIDSWMMPMTRLAAPEMMPSLDVIADTVVETVPPGAVRWQIGLPNEREPAVRLIYQDADGDVITRYIDPATGALLPDVESWGGTRFIFPFHFSLHLNWKGIGYWLVGLAGMAMLVMLVSGVIIHRKFFAEFFVFRAGEKVPRSSLDLHTLTGAVALPFNIAIALSGVIIFFSMYFPTVLSTIYRGEQDAFLKEALGSYKRDKAGEPGKFASLDVMAQEASRLWKGGQPYFVRVWYPGGPNGYVEIRRSFADTITMNLDVVYFDGPTGAVLSTHTAKPVMAVQRFISGLHFIQFDNWTLRWLYFALGLSGCVMIATGLIFWQSRRRKNVEQGPSGVRVVEGLTIGSVTGIILATLGFFLANRLLPLGAVFLGYQRSALEIWVFYLVWLASFAHAWARPGRAWIEQSWAIAGFAVLAVVLNAMTTGDHLVRTVSKGQWAVAGMDLMLLAAGVVAALAAHKQQGWRAAQENTASPETADAQEEQHV